MTSSDFGQCEGKSSSRRDGDSEQQYRRVGQTRSTELRPLKGCTPLFPHSSPPVQLSLAMHSVDIVDVRVNDKAANGQLDMRQEILDGLSKPQGEKTLPTLLLYDERGLRIYDEITTDADEYYLFGAEERILKEYADEIVGIMNARPNGSTAVNGVVLELGAG